LSVVYCTGESSFEVKIEADSNDITEHGNKGRSGSLAVLDGPTFKTAL